MPGPAPIMLAAVPPGLGQPELPMGMGASQPMPNQMAQPGGGSMGMAAVQEAMQFA